MANEKRSDRTARVLAEQRRKERVRSLTIVAAVVAVLVIIGVLTFVALSRQDTSGDTAKDVPDNLTGQYAVTVGRADAPKTITIYEDFQCPVCADFESVVGEQLRQAIDAGKVKLDLHMVAFLDRASTTRYSSRALNAAAVVLSTSGVDTFERFHTLLYENQPTEGSAGLSDAQLIQLAVQAGADEGQISEPIKDDIYHQWVVNATDQMSKDGVNGTPTVRIDGKPVGGTLAASIAAVQDAIK